MTANGERMRQIWVRKGSGEHKFSESVQKKERRKAKEEEKQEGKKLYQ